MSKHPSGRRDADAPFTLDSGETLGARALRLEHLLFEELYRLFRMEVNDPRLAELVPTSVQMSPDLRNAKVMYALREDPRASAKDKPLPRRAADPRARAIEDALQRVTPFLRTRLVDVVAMKRLPELHFHRDRMAEAALRAQELMTHERLAATRKALAVCDECTAASSPDCAACTRLPALADLPHGFRLSWRDRPRSLQVVREDS